jgi:hypothetical protein
VHELVIVEIRPELRFDHVFGIGQRRQLGKLPDFTAGGPFRGRCSRGNPGTQGRPARAKLTAVGADDGRSSTRPAAAGGPTADGAHEAGAPEAQGRPGRPARARLKVDGGSPAVRRHPSRPLADGRYLRRCVGTLLA